MVDDQTDASPAPCPVLCLQSRTWPCDAACQPEAGSGAQDDSFLCGQLAKEGKVKGDDPVWREDDQERSLALKILQAGRAVFETEPIIPADRADDGSSPRAEAQQPDGSVSAAPIGGPKTMLVLSLMQRPCGATIEDLMAAASWLPHTTRAALSGLRKKGVVIERRRAEQGKGSVYRVADGTLRQAA